LLDIKVDE